MGIKLTFLLITSTLVGCSAGEPNAVETENDVDPGLSSREVWTVVGDGDFENGEQLLLMVHGTNIETGKPWAANIYGLKITNGKREVNLLWMNSPYNPFGLKRGDQLRFKTTTDPPSFNKDRNGYYVSKNDFEIIDRNERNDE